MQRLFNKHIILNELKKTKKGLIIWAAALCAGVALFMLLLPVMANALNNPEFSRQVEDAGGGEVVRAILGSSAGFYLGMLQNFQLPLFIFAALTGVNLFKKEEVRKSAEFLMSQPVSRAEVFASKTAYFLISIGLLNAAFIAVSFLAVAAYAPLGAVANAWQLYVCMLIALPMTLLAQIAVGLICYGLSMFMNKGTVGLALGIVVGAYFLLSIYQFIDVYIKEDNQILKDLLRYVSYILPYGFTDAANIYIRLFMYGANADVINAVVCFIIAALYAAAAVGMTFIGYKKFKRKEF